ncbi:tRNA(Ile)-lysidine synthase [Lachnospiraceae bacterium]|nr:tRNA(Ile)-lysidine synthase [Lachnospiraceae bacterium]
MISPGDLVVAGVSGGADSMCLLFLLSELREKLNFELKVVHVNHGIRGEAANADEIYVTKICSEMDIPCEVIRSNIPEIAREKHLTEEEAGRIVRYEAFEKSGADRIAVAHHADDVAETMLFQLFRGSGLRGAGAIRPVRDKVIRPLLEFTREEIEEYCRSRQIEWRTDATNEDIEIARNRIRNVILPEAKKINPGAALHLSEAAERLREAEEYISGQADKLYGEIVSENQGTITMELTEIPPKIILEYVVKRCIKTAAGSEKDITAVHVHDAMALIDRQSGRGVDLPYDVRVRKEFNSLIFEKAYENNSQNFEGENAGNYAKAPENGETVSEDGIRWSFETECLSPERRSELDKNPSLIPVLTYTKWFDYDKIKGTVVLRTRRAGDRIAIRGGHRKIKDIFIEKKVPAEERDRLILLADGSDIIWIPGIRISEDHKVTGATKKIWKVSIKNG